MGGGTGEGNLERKVILKKTLETLDFVFVPSSFIRHLKAYAGDNKQLDNFFYYIPTGVAELARLGVYVAYLMHFYDKIKVLF